VRVLVADGLAEEGLRLLAAAGEVLTLDAAPADVTREIAQAGGITAARATRLPKET
jgi:hypothetical protein